MSNIAQLSNYIFILFIYFESCPRLVRPILVEPKTNHSFRVRQCHPRAHTSRYSTRYFTITTRYFILMLLTRFPTIRQVTLLALSTIRFLYYNANRFTLLSGTLFLTRICRRRWPPHDNNPGTYCNTDVTFSTLKSINSWCFVRMFPPPFTTLLQ